MSHPAFAPADCSKRARITVVMSAFPATRHSIVAAMRSPRADERRSAFDTLVTAYWKPVFKYMRLKWHAPPEDAADLTQGFFLRALEKDFFAGFDPSRARFRTYLRTCLDGFVVIRGDSGSRIRQRLICVRSSGQGVEQQRTCPIDGPQRLRDTELNASPAAKRRQRSR